MTLFSEFKPAPFCFRVNIFQVDSLKNGGGGANYKRDIIAQLLERSHNKTFLFSVHLSPASCEITQRQTAILEGALTWSLVGGLQTKDAWKSGQKEIREQRNVFSHCSEYKRNRANSFDPENPPLTAFKFANEIQLEKKTFNKTPRYRLVKTISARCKRRKSSPRTIETEDAHGRLSPALCKHTRRLPCRVPVNSDLVICFWLAMHRDLGLSQIERAGLHLFRGSAWLD